MTSQFLFEFCIILHSHDTFPLQILRSYLFYFGQKDPIKVPILTLSSALVKICQISQVFFSNHKSVSLQHLHNSSVSWKITPLYFCSLDFRVLGSIIVKFLMPILLFFIVITPNSSVDLSSYILLLWAKMIPSKFQFQHFRVLWLKFAKFLMSFSKQQVSFYSSFASLFSVMKDNSSVLS